MLLCEEATAKDRGLASVWLVEGKKTDAEVSLIEATHSRASERKNFMVLVAIGLLFYGFVQVRCCPLGSGSAHFSSMAKDHVVNVLVMVLFIGFHLELAGEKRVVDKMTSVTSRVSTGETKRAKTTRTSTSTPRESALLQTVTGRLFGTMKPFL